MQIKAIGNESAESFTRQNLSFDGFRTYPPELEIRQNTGICRYTLIPLQEGDLPLHLNAAVFDPASGKYVVTEFQKTLKVQKAISSTAGISAGAYSDNGSNLSAVNNSMPDTEKPQQSDILYLHKNITQKILLPLYRNTIHIAIFLAAGGLIIFILLALYAKKYKLLQQDTVLQRKMAAKSRKKTLLNKINALQPEEIPNQIHGDLTEYPNDLLGLPSGSSLIESADNLANRDPGLSQILKELAQKSWRPDISLEFNLTSKKALLKALAKLSVLLICFTIPWDSPAENSHVENTMISVSSPEEAVNAYDSGKFESALKYYLEQLQSHGVSGDLLYNIGNCYCKLNDLPRALIAYERALKLAPRDPDIQANLNFVRQQLLLPQVNSADDPYTMLLTIRNMVRFDEWILIAGLCMFILFCGLGAGFYVKKSLWVPVVCTAAVVLLLAILALTGQNNSFSKGDYGIIPDKKTELYNMPSTESGKVIRFLKAGEEVKVLEKRLKWYRVKAGNEEGWVKVNHLTILWPQNLADGLSFPENTSPENSVQNDIFP